MNRKLWGGSLVENSILLGIIVLASVGTLTIFGGNIKETFNLSKMKYKSYHPFAFSSNTQPSGVDPAGGGGYDPVVGLGIPDPVDKPPNIDLLNDTVVVNDSFTPGINDGSDPADPADPGDEVANDYDPTIPPQKITNPPRIVDDESPSVPATEPIVNNYDPGQTPGHPGEPTNSGVDYGEGDQE